MRFTERLEATIRQKGSLLCVGIDPVIERVPGGVDNLLDFCR